MQPHRRLKKRDDRALLSRQAVIELKREGRCRVVALDHDGRRTDPPVEVPVKRTADGARFVVDGAEYKTVYDVVEME